MTRLSNEWLIRKVADHEDEKERIAEIFERVNEARVQFEVCIILVCPSVASFLSVIAGQWNQSL